MAVRVEFSGSAPATRREVGAVDDLARRVEPLHRRDAGVDHGDVDARRCSRHPTRTARPCTAVVEPIELGSADGSYVPAAAGAASRKSRRADDRADHEHRSDGRHAAVPPVTRIPFSPQYEGSDLRAAERAPLPPSGDARGFTRRRDTVASRRLPFMDIERFLRDCRWSSKTSLATRRCSTRCRASRSRTTSRC